MTTPLPAAKIFKNSAGQTRYQPQLPTGERRYHHKHGLRLGVFDPKGIWQPPTKTLKPVLFRTARKATQLTALEQHIRATTLQLAAQPIAQPHQVTVVEHSHEELRARKEKLEKQLPHPYEELVELYGSPNFPWELDHIYYELEEIEFLLNS